MSLGDIRKVDHTILLCSHMQDTKAFYLDVMGFPLAHDSERWVSFQVGSSLLTLRPRGPGLAGMMVRSPPVRLLSSARSGSRHIWSMRVMRRCDPKVWRS
jgi:catechol 2,3-dioxygenase-like lactoylglutathione lyase family enzyme